MELPSTNQSSVWSDVVFGPASQVVFTAHTAIALRPRTPSAVPSNRYPFRSDLASDPVYTTIGSARRYVVSTSDVSPHPFRRDNYSTPIYTPGKRVDKPRALTRRRSFRTDTCFNPECFRIRVAYRLGMQNGAGHPQNQRLVHAIAGSDSVEVKTSCCRPSTKPVIKIDYASNYKAVIFDMGGVVLQLKEPQLLHAVLAKANSDGAKEKFGKMFMQWETGELPLDEFRKHILEIVGPTDVFDSGEKFMTAFLGPPDEHVRKAIKRIRAAGLKTALLTNTGFDSAVTKRPLIMKELEDFDAVVLSCELGQRKPGAEIYKHTAKQLGVKPEECIFLDDVLKNCEGAEAAGMAAIPVPHGETLLAVQELQKLLDIKLLD